MNEEKKSRRTRIALLIVACCGALLLARPAAAQDTEWESLNKEVMSLYQQGQYDRAVVVAKKALAVAEKTNGPNHPDVATSLENLSALYKAMGRDKEAQALAKRAAEIGKIKR